MNTTKCRETKCKVQVPADEAQYTDGRCADCYEAHISWSNPNRHCSGCGRFHRPVECPNGPLD